MPPAIPNPADRWQVPADLTAWGRSLQGRIPYVGASMLTSDDPAQAQLAVAPGVQELARWLVARFGLSSAGTRRGSAVRAPTRSAQGALRRRDLHEEGRAVDAMTSNIAKGTQIANLLVRVAPQLGIQYVLWRGLEWGSGRSGAAWEVYTGRSPHTDHVHLEVTLAMASPAGPMRTALAALDAEIARAGGITEFLASPLPGTPGGSSGGAPPAPPGPGTPPGSMDPHGDEPPVAPPAPPGPERGASTGSVVVAVGALLAALGGAAWWLLRPRPRALREARSNPRRRRDRALALWS